MWDLRAERTLFGVSLYEKVKKGKIGKKLLPSRKRQMCEGKLLGQNAGFEGTKAIFGVSLYEKVKKGKNGKKIWPSRKKEMC
jgi:hypothetical protein